MFPSLPLTLCKYIIDLAYILRDLPGQAGEHTPLKILKGTHSILDRHNGMHIMFKVSLWSSDINRKFPFMLHIFDNLYNFPILKILV